MLTRPSARPAERSNRTAHGPQSGDCHRNLRGLGSVSLAVLRDRGVQ